MNDGFATQLDTWRGVRDMTASEQDKNNRHLEVSLRKPSPVAWAGDPRSSFGMAVKKHRKDEE